MVENTKTTINSHTEYQSTGITCKTFCNRLYRCYYFKEKESYLKGVKLLFNKVLANYKLSNKPILDIFAKELSSRSFTGPRRIPANEKIEFRTFCTKCAINLSVLLDKYKIDQILDSYTYKWKIKGEITGVLHGNKEYNLQVSYESASLVQKELDFFSINNYIYNVTHGLKNDTLVMSVPHNAFFIVPYEERDYTIRRGFLTITKGTKIKLRGEHCLQCDLKCNPIWINGLDRLTSLI